ncbi:armadillo-type protein [Mrakia frigida]|uniref:regulator of nonsense transcripts 2 n=1 Tax=Mrakia frigida TaxID=29902 RepID=UPI003FCC0A07
MDPPLPSSDPLKKQKRSPLIAINQQSSSDSSSAKKSLDSSLKRHLSLLNRLRKNFSLEFKDAVLKDVEGLTLEKYAEEIVDACLEGVSGLGGKGDVFGVVEILTALNSRLSPDVFSTPLLTSFLALLGPPNSAALKALPADQRDREEKERVTKQRGVLRVLAEAEACGLRLVGGTVASSGRKSKVVLEEVVGMGWCMEDGLKGLLASDPLYTSLPLFTSFLKSYGRVYLGPPSVASDPSQDPIPGEAPPAVEEELVPVEMQKRLKALFDAYYEGLGKVVTRGRVRLQQQDLKNHEAYIKSGEIFEDRQQAYEKMTKEVERLMAGMMSLADLLHLPAPVFPALATSKGNSSVLVLDNSSSNPFARALDDIPVGGMWEDEEERKFYEDIVDLSEFVPGGILGVKEKTEDEKEKDKAVEAGAEQERKEREEKEADDIQRQLESLEEGTEVVPVSVEEPTTPETAGEAEAIAIADSLKEALDLADAPPTVIPEPVPAPATDEAGALLPAGPLARLNVIFTALPEITSKAALDQLAVDFAFLNSKPSRKRVIKFLGAVPKNRSDLLPMYSRLAATLNPFMPDVGQGLIAILDEEFRYLQRKKLVKELAEVRSKNIRYYCELAKFKVAQPHTILHVYKTLIDDLTGSNVECAALLLEGCGRFLLRSEETGERMKKMLELMRRKQGAQHFDQRLLLLLENAYYQCNPPERAAVQQKERPQMEQFIRHLIHDILLKKTVDKVLKLLRKLHWEDPNIVRILHKAFTKVWKLKFSNIGALAILVFEIARHHSDFATGVVDQVLEDIRAGLETNIFKHNQRRIATIKYLGELHYYRQVSSPVIFDVLWSLITFGHSEPIPIPGRTCPVDSADDFFRVRLICTLLDTCGMCFDKGSTKKKLDQFLTIFQLYVMCKKDAPMDVDFMISDTFDAIRPDLVPFKTFEDAGAAVDELLASQALATTAGDNESDASGSENGDERRDDDLEGEGDVNGLVDELDSEEESESDDEVDDDLVLQRLAKAQALAREEEDAFNREFSKMLLEQSEPKKGDRKSNVPIFDSAVPLMRKARTTNKMLEEEATVVAPTEEASGLMKFMLLTKKGNKPQTRMMDIPFDSPIAVNTRSNQMLDKLEQQQMKSLVLKHEERQELGEKQSIEALARARGIKLKFVGGP